MDRAFRAIHQMRPARNSVMSLEREPGWQTAWGKRTHENSHEQIQGDSGEKESHH